jgi:hypothetical protein
MSTFRVAKLHSHIDSASAGLTHDQVRLIRQKGLAKINLAETNARKLFYLFIPIPSFLTFNSS